MAKKPTEKQRRKQNVAYQTKFAKKKSETHRRMCVWIPLDKVDDFTAAVKRLKKKWSK